MRSANNTSRVSSCWVGNPLACSQLLNITRYPGAPVIHCSLRVLRHLPRQPDFKRIGGEAAAVRLAVALEEREREREREAVAREVDELAGARRDPRHLLFLSRPSPRRERTGAPRSFIPNSIHAIEFYITFPPSDEQLRIDYKRATGTLRREGGGETRSSTWR